MLDGGRALFYAAICWATAAYAAGGGQGSSGNAQSQDWTASALKLPYGRSLFGSAGTRTERIASSAPTSATPG